MSVSGSMYIIVDERTNDKYAWCVCVFVNEKVRQSVTEQRKQYFSMFYTFVSAFYMGMLRTLGKHSDVINDILLHIVYFLASKPKRVKRDAVCSVPTVDIHSLPVYYILVDQ